MVKVNLAAGVDHRAHAVSAVRKSQDEVKAQMLTMQHTHTG
jgi:hypothetical protein